MQVILNKSDYEEQKKRGLINKNVDYIIFDDGVREKLDDGKIHVVEEGMHYTKINKVVEEG